MKRLDANSKNTTLKCIKNCKKELYVYIYIERERERERESISHFLGENNIYKIKDNEKNIQNKRDSCKHQIIRTILCNRITLVANPCDAWDS